MEEGSSVSKDDIMTRHRKEKRDLQGKIQQLKKSINKDKKKKKEINDEITRLEEEQQERHEKELAEIENVKQEEESDISNGLAAVTLAEEPEDESLDGSSTDTATGQGRKLSKAAKRRQQKADANRAREAMIREERENNRFCARNVEAAKLKEILRARKLKMFEIKPDGDCMYAAMAHQMDEGTTVPMLRLQSGQFMRSHSDDFAPFITGKTGEMLSPEEFQEYCNQVESTSTWGGQPELRALSQTMKRRIEVLQAEGAPIIFGEENNDGKPPIILAYYRHCYGLGEHYNSVAVLTGEEDVEEVEET